MPVFAFATPTVAINPSLGEVVGTDPYDDASDATYIRARFDGDTEPTFCHVNAEFGPITFTTMPEIVVRANGMNLSGDAFPRMVMNLYPPGGQIGEVTPPLNLVAGGTAFNKVYVELLNDGVIRDVSTVIYDWNTEVPATLAQVNAYFSGGGCLLIQPTNRGNTVSSRATDLYVYRISIAGVEVPVATGRPDLVRRRFNT